MIAHRLHVDNLDLLYQTYLSLNKHKIFLSAILMFVRILFCRIANISYKSKIHYNYYIHVIANCSLSFLKNPPKVHNPSCGKYWRFI